MAASEAQQPTFVEIAADSPRLPTAFVVIMLPLAAWAWIAVMARDMYGPMDGASAWMMTPMWDLPHLFLLWAMWAVMMVGMMVPSAAPIIVLFGMSTRRAEERNAAGRIYALAAGYAAAWAAFSVGVTALQRVLSSVLLVTPMMELSMSRLGGALLIIAGLYQLSPMKQTCLRTCQSPVGFLMTRWRLGTMGAFQMGLQHGMYCVGCCWALMLLLFVGGVMNLLVIAALTAFVALEKLAPFGARAARISGALLIVVGLWMIAR